MTRQIARNIFEADGTTKAQLAEIYDGVIENIQANLISSRTKNTNLTVTGAGSLEAKRFVNINSDDYGTARAAGKGNAVKATPVPVIIDKHKEIIEELTKADVEAYGVADIIGRRANSHTLSMKRELERAYFLSMMGGTALVPTATDAQDVLEEAIVKLARTKNNYVDGVERDMMFIAASPEFHSKIKKYVNEDIGNANVDQAAHKIFRFNGVEIDETNYLPDGVDFIVFVSGVTTAQPIKLEDQYVGERIQLSNDIAVELFYDYGTTCVTPDLVVFKNAA